MENGRGRLNSTGNRVDVALVADTAEDNQSQVNGDSADEVMDLLSENGERPR